MFKFIGLLFKGAIFALIVLALGHKLHWGERTISDQVKVQLSHAERSEIAGKVRGWAGEVSREVQEKSAKLKPAADELIPATERQKLKALIRELNSSSRN
ncbi:MAG: hypothetical protein NDJ89_10050 [Oligoflexia bacterium]|nr:hypothetical protein [Oligoflexia bacterium]